MPSQGSWRKLIANYMSDPSPSHPSPSANIVVNPSPQPDAESSLHHVG